MLAAEPAAVCDGDPPVLPATGEFLGVVVGDRRRPPCSAAMTTARRTCWCAPHDPELFSGTIRDNVVLSEARTDWTSVLRASAADDVVAAHPDGLDHAISERGAALSGGQRQRIALARALLAGPRLLVLHDPTTAVDAVTEHAIARGIRDLRHRPGSALGTLLVTTSPALLAVTDRVVVLRDGDDRRDRHARVARRRRPALPRGGAAMTARRTLCRSRPGADRGVAARPAAGPPAGAGGHGGRRPGRGGRVGGAGRPRWAGSSTWSGPAPTPARWCRSPRS